jgi:hypothetical protein
MSHKGCDRPRGARVGQSMQTFLDAVEPALVDSFILLRGLRGPVYEEELGRMLAAVNVDWDERLVARQVEGLERTRLLTRRGTHLELTEEGRRDAERVLRLWGRMMDEAGVNPTAPPNPRLLNEPELRSGPGARPEGYTSRDRAGEQGKDRLMERRGH